MDTSSTSPKERKGLGKVWTKVKLALRPKSKSKSRPNQTSVARASNASQPQPHSHSSQQPAEIQRQEITGLSETNPAVMEPAEPVQTGSSALPPLEISSSDHVDTKESTELSGPSREKEEHTRRYERAQAIFKKYDIDFDDTTWDVRPRPQVERVHKAPRIRVRWTCHECKTTFGHDKVCVECAHHRCKTCTRYPPKKRKVRAAKKAALANVATEPSTEVNEGTCHECQTTFDMGVQECSNCHHQICERCLEESLATAETEQVTVAAT